MLATRLSWSVERYGVCALALRTLYIPVHDLCLMDCIQPYCKFSGDWYDILLVYLIVCSLHLHPMSSTYRKWSSMSV